MKAHSLNRSALIASVFTLSAIACNNIVGLSDLSVENASTAGNTDQNTSGTTHTSMGGSSTDPNGAGGVDSNGNAGTGASTDGDGGEPPIVIVGECTTNQECIDKFGADVAGAAGAGADVVPAVCIQPEQRCAKLLSEDC